MSIPEENDRFSIPYKFVNQRTNHGNNDPRLIAAIKSAFGIHKIVEQIDNQQYPG
jgi:hypothetical protein